MDEIEIAKGKLVSGTRFRLLVSDQVTADELRDIGNLLHGGAIKVEAELEKEHDRHE